MAPMSLKQRIMLAIKAKQKAAEQGNPIPYQQTQPLSSTSTMTMPKVSKAIFAQGERSLDPKFFKLKKKLSKL